MVQGNGDAKCINLDVELRHGYISAKERNKEEEKGEGKANTTKQIILSNDMQVDSKGVNGVPNKAYVDATMEIKKDVGDNKWKTVTRDKHKHNENNINKQVHVGPRKLKSQKYEDQKRKTRTMQLLAPVVFTGTTTGFVEDHGP